MKSVFEKIIDRLKKECFLTDMTYDDDGYFDGGLEQAVYLEKAIEIVKQEAEQYNNAIIDGKYCFQSCACTEKCDKCSRLCNGYIDWYENIDNWTEEYNNGWIPCSSGVMPRANGWYLVTNHLGVVQEQRWSANQWEKLRDDAVLAWQPLPEPYHPNGEYHERKTTNADRIRSMSDDELSVFLPKVKADYQWAEPYFPDVDDDWMDWLQSEVEEIR